MPRHLITRLGWVLLAGLHVVAARADQGQTASAKDSDPSRRACTCADGRQFFVGASLFGTNSARVVVKGFRTDPTQGLQAAQLPSCDDLTVVGQVIRLKTADDRPFLQREILKRGTIRDICQTKIQFGELKKSYDFFADDGTAVTLSDVDEGQHPPSADGAVSIEDDRANELSPDLTGKDLIQLIPREQGASDPRASRFDGEDLKEGAYCIIRRQVKAPPVDGQSVRDPAQTGLVNSERDPVTVWAGSLGLIERRTGFRAEPFWVVQILPHSAPPSFSRSLGSVVQALQRKHNFTKRVALASTDIVEINHFFDQYGVEWTRFGMASDEAKALESAGTTVLPSIYGPPELTLEQNLRNAQKARVFEAIQSAALKLTLVPKNITNSNGSGMLVLDESSGSEPLTRKTPHLLRQQCFLDTSKTDRLYLQGARKAPSILRVSDVDIRVFQPSHSAQVPDEYYAIDLKLQLKSESDETKVPVVCRFPFAAIDMNLLLEAERILSTEFAIQKRLPR